MNVKYLGILVVAALVLLGSVAMADLIAYGDWGALYGEGGINTSGIPHQTSHEIGCTLQVVVYPYLVLKINHTQFYWHLTQALGLDEGEKDQDGNVYYPGEAGVEVAKAEFITNWPAINIAWSGIGWDDNNAPSNLIPQWKLVSGDYSWGWYDHKKVNDGSYIWPVQDWWQPPQYPTGDHYELWSRIKIPAGTKPSPGTYKDEFTVTLSMAELSS
ncbi:MAG: hypothetical protein H5U36_01145 [Candidatus Caldatribacterium sp.]|nr:hypothetical protein [Candidatus Caldatribacterium sp.]